MRPVPVRRDLVQKCALARRTQLAELSNESIHPNLRVHNAVFRCCEMQ